MRRLVIVAAVLSILGGRGHGQAVPKSQGRTPPRPAVQAPPATTPDAEFERKLAEERRNDAARDAAEDKGRADDLKHIRKKGGEAAKVYEANRERVESTYWQLKADFDEMRGRYAAIGQVRSLHAFLVELRKLGEKVLSDEEAFKKDFEAFQAASTYAIVRFEKVAESFRKLAARAEFSETKGTYEKAAGWYDARAKVAKAKAKSNSSVLTDYPTEHRRLAEFVESLRQLELTTAEDMTALQGRTESSKDLAVFEEFYARLGDALQENTNKLLGELKDLEKGGRR
ncbi:MAG: hypothetical protein ACYCS7_03920 [Acidimicrobiales bacterium]